MVVAGKHGISDIYHPMGQFLTDFTDFADFTAGAEEWFRKNELRKAIFAFTTDESDSAHYCA